MHIWKGELEKEIYGDGPISMNSYTYIYIFIYNYKYKLIYFINLYIIIYRNYICKLYMYTYIYMIPSSIHKKM